ncbi:Zuotin [Mycoemilia scoparia]|uniref:Zuotin n=1 Tax=Mycoemilia scoparia TaxID=417184 RepID=A0A9W8DRL0_9FUNG|nr:Zuotin [Mycoemilia scoparia]
MPVAQETIAFTLPSLPADVSKELAKVHSSLSEFKEQTISPVGIYAEHYSQNFSQASSTNTSADYLSDMSAQGHLDEITNRLNGLSVSEDDDDSSDEEVTRDMLLHDPKEWKEQDHYAVMGLSKLRFNATLDDVVKQHRKRVLKYHPDKMAAILGTANNDSFFKCIQKAYEILTDPVKRRQWDSVDPAVSTEIPNPKAKGYPWEFFETYGPIFERESRYSNIQPVPLLGDSESPREDVENFYNFWYNFDSWRSFEYLDKEDAEGADNRDNKRYIEKKNKAARAKAKKDDNARVHKLVDQAIKADPRMARFKEEDKKRRNAKKYQKQEEERKALEAKKKAEEEAKLAAEKAEAEAKVARESAKRDKEATKKAIKKEKKSLKNLIKGNNYFLASSEEDPTPEQIGAQLEKLDRLIETNKDAVALETLRVKLEAALAAGNVVDVFEAEYVALPPSSE